MRTPLLPRVALASTLALSAPAPSLATTWFVDDSVAASGSGAGWNTAFKTLTEGLNAAASGDEIRVGQGVYKPAGVGGNRNTAFVMKSNVAVRGGYAGFGAAFPDLRDFVNTPSVLSGDLNANDTANFGNNAENSINVVTVPNSVVTLATLEGFTITAGNANLNGSLNIGGGAIAIAGTIDVRQCVISQNTGSQFAVGAVECFQAGANRARFFRCTFLGNRVTTTSSGGVVVCSNTGPTDFVNCGFYGNSSTIANSAAGVATNGTGIKTLTNCVFSGNTAPGPGAALRHASGTATLVNCTIASNSCTAPGAAGAGVAVTANGLNIVNSIVWGNTAPVSPQGIVVSGGSVSTSYCDLQDGGGGTGNVSADPLFVDPDGADNILGTVDDNLTLQNGYPGSPCLDRANAVALPADIADLDADANVAEPIPFDFALLSRRVDNALTDQIGPGGTPSLDMGAYEDQLSFFAVPATIYVDATSTAAVGTSPNSWATALREVRFAAYISKLASAPAAVDVRAAQGLYRAAAPGTAPLGGNINWAINFKSLTGGYAGLAGTSPDTRDPAVFQTVISGDVNADDQPGFVNYADNLVQPFLFASTSGAVIDGVVFTGINGPGSLNSSYYPGVFGGADSVIRNCVFRANRGPAGILYPGGGDALVINCTFSGNECLGLVPSGFASPVGGVVSTSGASTYIVNCGFYGNASVGNPVLLAASPTTMVNCVVSGNTATGTAGGGAIRKLASASPLSVINCTFANNASLTGPGSVIVSPLAADNAVPSFANCILWGNTAPGGSAPVSGAADMSYCDVQGGYVGAGNISADPLFADADGADNLVGTVDDNLAPATHLSPVVDAALFSSLPADTANLDADANTTEPLPLDFALNPRNIDGNDDFSPAPDMGAYEYQRSVRNLTFASLHASIAGAIGYAGASNQLLAPANQFAIEPAIDFLGKSSLSLASAGAIGQPAGGLWTLAPGAQVNAAAGQPMNLGGEVRVPANAYTTLSASIITGSSSASLNLFNGSTMSLSAPVSMSGSTRLFAGSSLFGTGTLISTGTLNALAGSTLSAGGSLALNGPSTLLGASVVGGATTIGGQTNWTGTSISAPSLSIANTGRFTGSGNIYAPITNSGRIYTIGNSVFVGNLTNNAGGIITVQIGTATLIGTLVNNGTINGVLSNPPEPPPPGSSEDEFAFHHALMANLGDAGADRTSAGDGMFIRGDYVAGAASSLSLPDAVWRLTVAGSYDVAINSNANYDMRVAELVMARPDTGSSALEAMSLDRGAVNAGLDRTLSSSYPIGTLRIGAGASVSTVDARDNANDGQAACEAVYCENLIIESGAVLTATNCRVYYKTLTNNGAISTPANVIRVPPPCGGADFNHDGVVNTADLTQLLLRFGQSAPVGSPAAAVDLNADGVITTADLTLLLLQFGRTCA